MSDERRRTPRLRAYLPAQLSRAGISVAETLTKDIGLGGLRCISSSLTPVGCHVSIEVSLPRTLEMVTLRGRIAWFRILPESEQFDLGIAFLDVPEKTKRLLSTYFEHPSSLIPA